jgi:hypothetical protein
MENYVINGKVVDITLENGKVVKAMTSYLENMVKMLDIDMDEAVLTWLEDEGYLENEEVEALTKKAKDNKAVVHEAKADKPRKQVKRERKPDEEKENLIEILANCLTNAGFETKITNKSKIIEFNVGENHYKLDLIRQRPPKK